MTDQIVFVEPEMLVATWRTGWPAQELKRRGYNAVLSARGQPFPDIDASATTTFVLHILNRTWEGNGEIITPLDLCVMFRERGRLIVSFSDDLTQVLELESGPPRPRARMLHQQIPVICRMASKIVVTTPRLAEVYGRWGEVAIAEALLPQWVLDLPRAPRKPRVAWMGHIAGKVHGRDWDMLKPYAKDLPPLTLIGTEPKSAKVLMDWGAKDVETRPGFVNQKQLYRELGRWQAAICPILDTRFNRGKSWIKPMEFMARGVQPFASAHAEYVRLGELTGAVPTFEDPGELVAAVAASWELRDGDELPFRLIDAGLTMEQLGGDAWEKALI